MSEIDSCKCIDAKIPGYPVAGKVGHKHANRKAGIAKRWHRRLGGGAKSLGCIPFAVVGIRTGRQAGHLPTDPASDPKDPTPAPAFPSSCIFRIARWKRSRKSVQMNIRSIP
eukprot:gene26120-11838_t